MVHLALRALAVLTAAVTTLRPAARARTADPVVFYGLFGLLLFGPLAFERLSPGRFSCWRLGPLVAAALDGPSSGIR